MIISADVLCYVTQRTPLASRPKTWDLFEKIMTKHSPKVLLHCPRVLHDDLIVDGRCKSLAIFSEVAIAGCDVPSGMALQ